MWSSRSKTGVRDIQMRLTDGAPYRLSSKI